MDFKEKIIQYWLTFILTFLGFSKTLIIFPVFLQIDIYNKYLVGAIDFIFTPAVYASDLLGKWFIFSSFETGAPTLLFNPIIVIINLVLFAGESYVLAWMIIFLLESESTKTLFFRYFYIIKGRLKNIGGKILGQFGIKEEKYYFPVIVIIVLFFGILGYLFFDRYSINTDGRPNNNESGVKKITIDLSGLLHSRDDRRIINLDFYSQALDNYLINNDKYPIAETTEKISEESSNIFQILSKGGFLTESYKDPSGGDKYYGYKSDGVSYELTAVLEDSKDSRCSIKGNYCIYRLKKEIPKCEFSGQNGNYTSKGFKEITKSAGKYAGLVRQSQVSYSYYNSPSSTQSSGQYKDVNSALNALRQNMNASIKQTSGSTADINFLEFDNRTNAENYLGSLDRSSD